MDWSASQSIRRSIYPSIQFTSDTSIVAMMKASQVRGRGAAEAGAPILQGYPDLYKDQRRLRHFWLRDRNEPEATKTRRGICYRWQGHSQKPQAGWSGGPSLEAETRTPCRRQRLPSLCLSLLLLPVHLGSRHQHRLNSNSDLISKCRGERI